MEKAFIEIAEKVTPTNDFLKAAKITSNNVFDKLRGCPNSNLKVVRVLIGGSIGKKTAINENFFETDFDLVVFVNKYQGQKEEDILKICLEELTRIPGFTPKPRNAITGNLLQFSLPVTVGRWTRSVEFDLVIATNYGDQQVAGVLGEIGENLHISTIHRHGPSLSRETVALVRDLSKGSTRDVVRVAKFWDKTLKKYDSSWRFVAGRSYLIELIAIAANKDALDNSVYQGFLRFLRKMAQLGNLNVVFTEGYNYYQIPASIRDQRPLVMDPLNFYYNVAQGMGSENIKKYEAYADKTERMIAANQGYPLSVDNFHQIIGFSN